MPYRRSFGYRRAPPRRRAQYARTRATGSRYPPRRRAPARRRRAPARGTRDPQTGGCHCPGDMTSAQKFVLATLDPFDPRSLGAKVPDASTMPSLSVVDVENQGLTLGVITNQRCFAFLPQYTTAYINSTEGAAGWTWPAAFAGTADRSKRAAYIGAYELDRPIAHAVRLSSPVAPTAATGFVHIAVAFESMLGLTTWPWPSTTSALSGYAFYKRVTLASLTQSPLTIVNKYCDETAFRYQSANTGVAASGFPATNNEFHVNRSWGAILIAIEGSSSLAPLEVEHLLMTEAIPQSSSVLTGTTAAPFQPSVLAGAGHATANTDFAHTESQQDTYVNQGIAAVAEGMQAAGNEAFNGFVVPLLQNVGYGTVAAAVNYGLGIGGVNNNPNRLAA